MTIDEATIARVVGITTRYKPRRGGRANLLPQRILVIAQGDSDVVYSTDKVTGLTPAEVGQTFGFGSPAHLIYRKLYPTTGGGVGSIPVSLIPLQDHSGGQAAKGEISVTGARTANGTHRVRVSGIRSEPFVIRAGATTEEVYAAMGQAIQAVLHMPVRVLYDYGAPSATPDGGNTGDGTVTAVSVTGAPLPGKYNLVCIEAVTDGGKFALTGPNGEVIADDLNLNAGAGQSTQFDVGGLQFTITDGATDFAEGDAIELEVPCNAIELEAKWKGDSGNDLRIAIEGDPLGLTFAITQPTGGLLNPSIEPALAKIGDVWETLVINALGIRDTDALDALLEEGIRRWGTTVKKPFVAFVGQTSPAVQEATAISSQRSNDLVNAQIPAPGSEELPFVVAARGVARIAVVANENPPLPYAGQKLDGIAPGALSVQWDHETRDRALRGGCSTVELVNDTLELSQVVTFYAPPGETPPGFRFVRDIVKLQNILFNLGLIFEGDAWKPSVLIPDDQDSTNPRARRPRNAVTDIRAMIDLLALEAIIADPETAKEGVSATISSSNPNVLLVDLSDALLSSAADVVGIDLQFGFYVGNGA